MCYDYCDFKKYIGMLNIGGNILQGKVCAIIQVSAIGSRKHMFKNTCQINCRKIYLGLFFSLTFVTKM